MNELIPDTEWAYKWNKHLSLLQKPTKLYLRDTLDGWTLFY